MIACGNTAVRPQRGCIPLRADSADVRCNPFGVGIQWRFLTQGRPQKQANPGRIDATPLGWDIQTQPQPPRGRSNKAQGNALGMTGANSSPSPERARYPCMRGDVEYFALSGLDDIPAISPRPLAWALLSKPLRGKLRTVPVPSQQGKPRQNVQTPVTLLIDRRGRRGPGRDFPETIRALNPRTGRALSSPSPPRSRGGPGRGVVLPSLSWGGGPMEMVRLRHSRILVLSS